MYTQRLLSIILLLHVPSMLAALAVLSAWWPAVESFFSLKICDALQDPIYRPNYYLSLMEFRDLTLRRLQKYVDQQFFSTFDYLRGEPYLHCHLTTAPMCHACLDQDWHARAIKRWRLVCADPLRFMAGLETLASVDYSLCIKAGVHFTLCGGEESVHGNQCY